ncbi:MAG: SUF system NifU family Fe-S cluster assembly protein [Erysipelotrichaceae bacterium]|nr:SUF system NifU family Fe-S cluster assembly protein [Erysipelotrichaceae bacterium]
MAEEKDLFNDPDFIRALIMDHYQYPHNHQLKESDSYLSRHMASDSCIDDITVQLHLKDDVIDDVCFDGVACTISTASTSMMTDLVIGKTIPEARRIIDEYMKMIDNREFDPSILEEAVAFKNVYRQANRIKCATIGWNALKDLLEESEDRK